MKLVISGRDLQAKEERRVIEESFGQNSTFKSNCSKVILPFRKVFKFIVVKKRRKF